MFNTAIDRRDFSSTTNIEVKQAGVHDAARLYGEIKADTAKQVLRGSIEEFGADNHLKVLLIEKQADYCQQKTWYFVRFSLNGCNHEFKLEQDCFPLMDSGRQAIVEDLIRLLSIEIAAQIFKGEKK